MNERTDNHRRVSAVHSTNHISNRQGRLEWTKEEKKQSSGGDIFQKCLDKEVMKYGRDRSSS